MQDPGAEAPANSMFVPCDRPLAGRRVRSHPTQVLKCPRCDSLNTKFCYFNNYNLSQPRHFCKNCRRYWTKGGVLRNVPVGGGCRKNKRSKTPRNSEHRASPSKSSSNSTTVSSENSTITVAVQEASSASNSCVKIPDGERFDHETLMRQILSMPDPLRLDETVNCDAVTGGGGGGGGPESAIPRLLNGLASLDYGLPDWQLPAQHLTNSGNLFSDVNSNPNPYGNLVSGSNPAGVSFSDLQWKLQQQPKMGSSMEEPRPESRCINALSSGWQANHNGEVLVEMANDLCCWSGGAVSWSDQELLYLP